MTSSDTPQSGGAQVPSLQSLSHKTHSIWPLQLMHIIHDRKSSTMHLGSGEGDTRAGVSATEWMTEKRRETEEGVSKTRDKETVSLKGQSNGEFNNSGETDHMHAVQLHKMPWSPSNKNKMTAVCLNPMTNTPPASSLEHKYSSNEQEKASVLRARWMDVGGSSVPLRPAWGSGSISHGRKPSVESFRTKGPSEALITPLR